MSYVLSCGCKSEYGGFPSEWDSETRECEPAVSYGCLCEKHFQEYEARPAQFTSQEPVAWMTEYATEGQHGVTFDERLAKEYGFDIPLYTAPRELSDEEIYEVWSTLPYDDQCPFDGRATYRFARAILKKASEK